MLCKEFQKNAIVDTCPCLGVWTAVLPRSTSVHLYVLELLVLLFPSVQFPNSEQLSAVFYSCSSILVLREAEGPERDIKSFNFGSKQRKKRCLGLS